MRQRLLAPALIQSSAMDCGPAALGCLAEGFGLDINYERLREICQIDVDGTSIDAIEDAAVALGLAAEQVLVPVEHLALPKARTLPALAVVANSLGVTHFVVVWRRSGPWLQVMDPASGRRWTTLAALRRELYHHSLEVAASAWHEWALSEDFLAPLATRLRTLGLGRRRAGELLANARGQPDWRSLAALDAAARMAATLVAEGAIRRGAEPAILLRSVLAAQQQGEPSPVPDRFWTVLPPRCSPADDGSDRAGERVSVRGIVLVRVQGRGDAPAVRGADLEGRVARAAEETDRPAAAAVTAALTRRSSSLRQVGRLVTGGESSRLVALGIALPTAAAAAILEILLLRGLLDLGERLALPVQRTVWAGFLLLFLLVQLGLEASLTRAILGLGRKLDVSLRVRLLERIPQLGDRYFRSRLSSDMAERCHSLHRLRLFPEIVSMAVRVGLQIGLTVIALAWSAPGTAPVALLAGLAAVAVPLAAQPLLRERDLRLRTHAGALTRFSLDSLLGVLPVRAHAAERAVRREHEALLTEWVVASYSLERAVLAVEVIQTTAGYPLAIVLVVAHLARDGGAGSVLLVAFWAVTLQMLGQQLVVLGRQLPGQRSAARRLLEPLEATVDEGEPATAEIPRATAGVRIEWAGVGVVAAGRTILHGVDLAIAEGEAVAVIGASGAGKSTLLGLLLGWHSPAEGRLWLDGEEAGEDRIRALRGEIAWIDPAVFLWNRSLLANLLYGAEPEALSRLGTVIHEARLAGLVESLPEGLQSSLGEGGALVSGGEGQRVRLGRALLHRRPRLVLLDEPFRGLDRQTRRELLERSRRWWQGATQLVVTHDVEAATDYDRVIVLADGRIAEQGAPDGLLADPGSTLSGLLAKERRLRAALLDGSGWRRFHLHGGALEEERPERPGELGRPAWRRRCAS